MVRAPDKDASCQHVPPGGGPMADLGQERLYLLAGLDKLEEVAAEKEVWASLPWLLAP